MAHPRMYNDSNPALKRLRKICLALPECFEKEAWGECTFRVTGRSMFAMTDNDHHGSRHIAVWVKAPVDVQEMLVAADPKRFFVPPYVGSKGWLGVRLDYKVDWEEVADILKDGHAMAAPKRARPRAAPGDAQAVARPRRRGSASAARPSASSPRRQRRRS